MYFRANCYLEKYEISPPNSASNNQDNSVLTEAVVKTINHKIQNEWNDLWIQQSNRTHLRKIKHHTYQYNPVTKFSRGDQVILTRIRIGHSRITHQHLISKENPPICEKCNSPLSIDHIILNCKKYNVEREKYNCNKPLDELLNTITNCSNLLKLLQDINIKNYIL